MIVRPRRTSKRKIKTKKTEETRVKKIKASRSRGKSRKARMKRGGVIDRKSDWIRKTKRKRKINKIQDLGDNSLRCAHYRKDNPK